MSLPESENMHRRHIHARYRQYVWPVCATGNISHAADEKLHSAAVVAHALNP